jgi:hypothetical protein
MKPSCCPASYSSDLGPVSIVPEEVVCCRLTDSWSVNPWIVQVTLSTLNQENLKLMVKIGQSGKDVSEPEKSHRQHKEATDLPATTHPQLPPPHTIISTSSGTVILKSMRSF